MHITCMQYVHPLIYRYVYIWVYTVDSNLHSKTGKIVMYPITYAMPENAGLLKGQLKYYFLLLFI